MKRNNHYVWGVINIFSPLIWLLGGMFVGLSLFGISFTYGVNEDFTSEIIVIFIFLLFAICIGSCVAGFIVALRKKQSICWILSIIGFCLNILTLFGVYYLGSRY